MHVLLTRPYLQSVEMKRQLEEIGCRVSIEPVLEISPVQYSPEIYKNSKAFIVTSVHAASEIAKQVELVKSVPIYAVGSATAKPLREADFKNIVQANGNAKSLLALIKEKYKPKDGLITYLSGQHITQDLANVLSQNDYDAQRVVCYKALPVDKLSINTSNLIRKLEIDCVILMSYRTAFYFNALNKKARTLKNLKTVKILTMSNHIVKALEKKNYGSVFVTSQPSTASFISAVKHLKNKNDAA